MAKEYTNKMRERRELLLQFFERKDYVPMKFKDIASLFQVPKAERGDLQLILNDIIKEGKLVENGEGRYTKPDADLITGTFMSTAKGFAFLRTAEDEEDVFIPASEVSNAFDGDTVTVKLLAKSRGKSREGKVVKVIERAFTTVVGTFEKSRNFGFVVPDNTKITCDIYIPKNACKDVPKGVKVVVELTSYGDAKFSPEGKIIEILGFENDKGVDILSIAKAYGIEDEFPKEVCKEVKKVPAKVIRTSIKNRLDLREMKIVTIDGEDAKDLDDAVSVTKEVKADGEVIYHLGVHIADVTNYVKEGSALDKEAIKRGTSAYLVNKVIPMLPKELSNGICSLNENVDRLTLSCLMDINEKGEVISHEIAETVIRTAHRMNYSDVNVLITGEGERFNELKEKYEDVYEMLVNAEELALILRKHRHERGSIDFDFPEAKIIVDDKGRVTDIKAYDRNEATRLIEDFMLIANETVAEDSFWQELPFVYRTHENPDEEKIRELSIFINNFGYNIGKGGKKKSKTEIHPKDIQKLLSKIEGTPEEMLINRMTLRSLKRAKYTTSCDGHFGLAAKYYCHFTSPIRRYPDLQIHRIIKENLNGRLTDKRVSHYKAILYDIALRSSMMERRADEAEREADKMKAAEFMSHKIGEEFEGVISGVTSWGIYVELPNTVEGMVKISSIRGDYYEFNAERMEIVGEHTKKSFSLGQQVRVKVVEASKQMRTIDFRIVEGEKDV